MNPDKFPLVLQRVIRKLHLKSGKIFSEAEEAQLQALLSLNATNLHTVLEVCSYVFEQGAYHNAGVDKLGAQLKLAGVIDDSVEAFQRVWGSDGAAFMAALKERTLGGPLVLSSTKWQMGMQLGSTGAARAQATASLFEFSLSNPDDAAEAAAAGGGAEAPVAEKFFVEFSHDQLYDFFMKMEKVQEQIDALS